MAAVACLVEHSVESAVRSGLVEWPGLEMAVAGFLCRFSFWAASSPLARLKTANFTDNKVKTYRL